MSKKAVARREPSYFDDRVVLHIRRGIGGKKLTTDKAGQGVSRKAITHALDHRKTLELDCEILSRRPDGDGPTKLLGLARKVGRIGHGHGQEHIEMALVGMSEPFSQRFERVLGSQLPGNVKIVDREFALSPATRTVYSPTVSLQIGWERSPQKIDLLARLIARDGALCSWCRQTLTVASMAATVDHVLPRSHGGPNGADNLLLSCADCNHRRGNVAAEEWLRVCLAAGQAPVVANVLAALERQGLTHGGLVLVKAA